MKIDRKAIAEELAHKYNWRWVKIADDGYQWTNDLGGETGWQYATDAQIAGAIHTLMETIKQPLFGVNKIVVSVDRTTGAWSYEITGAWDSSTPPVKGDAFPFNSPTDCFETILRLYDLDPPREGRQ